MHPHLYELDHVQLTIQQNHRNARHQAQLDVGRGTPRLRIATFAVSLRSGIATILIATGERLHRAQATSQQPGVEQQPIAKPADTAVTA